jgi:hypothetical protein
MNSKLADFAQTCFAGLGCRDFGVVVEDGRDAWELSDGGRIDVAHEGGLLSLFIEHDERGGPFAADAHGAERRHLLLSLSDEDGRLACAWAEVDDDSPLLGVGVDLCSAKRLVPRTDGRVIARLVLHEDERHLAHVLCPGDDPMGYAMLFAAKEAAFKACAAPLRRWYEAHDEELRFDLRHFVMRAPGLERGDGRNGAAQRAVELMGIKRIQTHHTVVDGQALVIGLALGDV